MWLLPNQKCANTKIYINYIDCTFMHLVVQFIIIKIFKCLSFFFNEISTFASVEIWIVNYMAISQITFIEVEIRAQSPCKIN